MKEISVVDSLLEKLGLAFERTEPKNEVVHYEITVDPGEELGVNGMLYTTEDGAFFRLIAYVDEVSQDSQVEQLMLLLTLNMDIPTGAFCMDPDENAVMATVNIPVSEITADLLSWVIEFLLVAQEVYFEEFYGPEELPEG